jgi:GT2 family glycosyltransferase
LTLVQPDEQLEIAQLLSEQRDQLTGVIRELLERQTQLSELEARLLSYSSTSRLTEVEHRLRVDALQQNQGLFGSSSLGTKARRIRGLAYPKIGRLKQYPPRRLLIPEAYLRTAALHDPPRISIVTPSFQQGRYLARTMRSVINQNYPNLEYVVQDGGSTDGTLETLERFDDALTFWASEPDAGQADAINRGFTHTTGDIMAWLNSDDLYLPGALAYVAKYFVDHPEVDVVYGNRRMIDQDDAEIGAWILPKHDDRILTLVDYVPQETLFWRRSIWDAAGGRLDADFGYALDWDLLLRFRDAGATIVRLPRFIGAFRVHDEQKTSAQDWLGAEECARLRERVHGRPISPEEAGRETIPYLRRHILVHSRQRLIDRMPLRKVDVHPDPGSEPPRKHASNGTRSSGQAAQSSERQGDSLPL